MHGYQHQSCGTAHLNKAEQVVPGYSLFDVSVWLEYDFPIHHIIIKWWNHPGCHGGNPDSCPIHCPEHESKDKAKKAVIQKEGGQGHDDIFKKGCIYPILVLKEFTFYDPYGNPINLKVDINKFVIHDELKWNDIQEK